MVVMVNSTDMSVKKISFEYQFIVFLSAYLRQIDLSLDRSRWTSWGGIARVLQKSIEPQKGRKLSFAKFRF